MSLWIAVLEDDEGWIGQQEAQAKEMDDLMPGAGKGQRMMANVVRVKRDVAIAAMNSGDVVAMIAAYEQLKPAVELAHATSASRNFGASPASIADLAAASFARMDNAT